MKNKFKKLFSFKNILLLSFYILVFFILLKNSYSYLDPDFGWHLRFGQEILQNNDVPRIEHVYFTLSGKSWVDHEWLINAFSYFLYSNFGYLSLNIFFALIALSLFVFANYYFLKKYKLSIFNLSILLFIEILGLFGIVPHFGVRMQEITVLFLLLLFFIIYNFEKNRNYKILIFIPVLFYFWACLHAGFMIGFMTLFVFACAKTLEIILKKFSKINFIKYSNFNIKDIIIFCAFSLLSLVATFFTPYGLNLYSFLFSFTNTYYLTHIQEWLPAYYLSINPYQSFYLSVAMTFAILPFVLLKEKKIKIFPFLMLLILIVLYIKIRRNFPLLFVCSLFVVADYLNFLFGKYVFDIKYKKLGKLIEVFTILFILLIALSVFSSTVFFKNPFLYFDKKYPVAVVDCINNDKINNQRLFSDYNWGGYLEFMTPNIKMFMDGRMSQYSFNGKSIFEEYAEFYNEKNVESMLNKYDIRMVVTKKQNERIRLNFIEKYLGFNEEKVNENRDNKLKEYLDKSGKWRIECEGKIEAVYVRN